MAKKIRGVMFEENLKNSMGLEFVNLSHRFGYQSPNWPYFEDVKIERIHYMAKSGVLSQRITTSMHNTTHIDAPAHVVQGTPFIDEVPLPHFFGSGIVVSIPKKMWEPITYDDLEKAAGKIVRPRDVVIVNTGWHNSTRTAKNISANAPASCRRPATGSSRRRSRLSATTRKPTIIRSPPPSARTATARCIRISPKNITKWSGGRDWKDDSPGMGAGASHAVQQRHSRHRERRRRPRQGHRQARHLRLLPVELGSRRRLHHPSRRHHRSDRQVPHRTSKFSARSEEGF